MPKSGKIYPPESVRARTVLSITPLCYNKFVSTPATTVTLELRTARDNEAGPEAAAQIFTALPLPPRGLKKFWKKPVPVTFEWLNQGQMTYAFATFPADQIHHMQSQIVAHYPEALIQPLEHNPLDEFTLDKPKAWTELRLAMPSYLPLRSYQDYKDVDPLAAVLSSLAKLREGEIALVQLRLYRADDAWKNSGYSAAKGQAASGEGASAVPPHPHKEMILHKLKEPSFAFSLNVVAQADTKERAQQILESVTTALNSLQSETNNFIASKPWIGRQKYLQKIFTREVKVPKQYLSVHELATIFHLPNKKLSTVRNIAWGKNLLGEPPQNLPIYTGLAEESKEEINLIATAEYKNQTQIFGIKNEDRRRHMYVIGKSGTGKSTLLANMIINDLKHDEGIAVVDPHGDLVETVLDYIPKRRVNDVIILDPSDPVAVARLNLFEAGSSVHRELVASGIVSIFQKMYGYTWGPRLEYILRNSLLTLLYHNAQLSDILRILVDKKYRDQIVENTNDAALQNFWITEYNRMNEKQRVDAISPILNKVGQFVTSPMVRRVVDTKVSSFNIEDVMNQGKILLVNVSQGKLGEDNAALLGAMVITKIQLAAMNRVYMKEEERRDFYLYIDEFQNFATSSFIKILSEARKYRLNLTLANQYIDQIPEDVRLAIFGNAGNIISFIVGASDADHLAKEFGNKYSPEDLVSLSRYQIIMRMLIDGQASSPFPAHTLNLASSRNQNREKVIRVSRERYSKKVEE